MIRSKFVKREKRAKIILKELKKLFPKAGMSLKYSNNWELLVAVILSAQSTDKQINKVTSKLFKKYRRFDDYLKIRKKEFERDIYSSGFYQAKAKSILSAAKYLKKYHNGKLPKTMKEMIKIPGVGRKTANVVLGNAYGVVEGIAVDTHVIRLSRVLDLTDKKTPKEIEKDLMKLFPKKEWFSLTYYLIEYGRNYCPARKHNHKKCPLLEV